MPKSINIFYLFGFSLIFKILSNWAWTAIIVNSSINSEYILRIYLNCRILNTKYKNFRFYNAIITLDNLPRQSSRQIRKMSKI